MHLPVLYADTKTFDSLCKEEEVLTTPFVQEKINDGVKKLQEKNGGAPVTEEELKAIQIKAVRSALASMAKRLTRCLGGFYGQCGDYCQLGGRFSGAFIVKEDCPYAAGVKRFSVPKGYIRVDAARKKDIEWDVMREWATKELLKGFPKLQKAFETKSVDDLRDYFCPQITEEGIDGFGWMLYKAGETQEEYLLRHGIGPSIKYCCTHFDEYDDSQKNSCSKEWPEKGASSVEFYKQIDALVDSLPDNAFLLNLDCHR